MRLLASLLIAACAVTACQKAPAPAARRVELKKITGTTLELVPSAGQLPYCLVYTASQKGVVRQLTMNFKNESIPCEAGKPIRNVAFRVPMEEGPVRVYVIFSDRKLNAGTVAQQIYENIGKNEPNALDLRQPGQVVAERLEFTPTEDGEAPATGGLLSPSGELAAPADAGTGAMETEPTTHGG